MGLATASGIILMRPLVMIIMVVEAPILFGKALAVAVWIAFVWSLFGSLFYVLHTYTLPTLRLKRLQNDGSCASTGYIHCPLQDFIPGMTVYSYKMIDSRTILIKLGERVDKNEADDFDKSGIDKKMAANSEDKIIQDAVADNQKKSKDIGGKKLIEIKRNYTFPINIPPGCHIVLKLGDVLREYTPINNEDELDSNVEILLRLIPNGKFSLLISNLLGLNDATKNIPHGIWIDCNVPCGVYGPLFPLPSKFGYFPQYCVDAKIDENVHSITGSNESSISISISDHNTKAGAGIKHKNESNEMIRRYYSDDNSSDNTIRKTSINSMIILIGAGTGITPFFKVIQAALRNKKDQTNIRLLTLLGKSEQKNDEINFSTYVEAKVDNLKKLSDVDNNQKNRFESMNFETRFSKSMLHSWIYQSTSSVAKKDNNCSGSGAGKQSDNFSMSKTEDTIVWICGPPGFGENTRTILTKKCSSNNRGDNGKSFSFLKEQIFVFGVDDR